MGAYVTRKNPSTGLDREYYKADDGKLYSNYDSAANANMNPIARMQRGVGESLKQIGNQGLIPIPTFNNTSYSGAGYFKSLAGPLGRPFAIQSNPKTDKFLQQTIDAASKNGNTITFNQDIANKEAYDRLGSSMGNKAFGRYTGTVDAQGNVIVKDDYDTNRSVGWHLGRTFSGKDAQGKELGIKDRLISGISAIHRKADNLGLTNARPYGTEVVIGNINRAQPTRMAGQADITVDNTAAPGPATNYAVQAGDTLSSIAADRGTTVADLVRRNNIANPNLIQIGQIIR